MNGRVWYQDAQQKFTAILHPMSERFRTYVKKDFMGVMDPWERDQNSFPDSMYSMKIWGTKSQTDLLSGRIPIHRGRWGCAVLPLSNYGPTSPSERCREGVESLDIQGLPGVS